ELYSATLFANNINVLVPDKISGAVNLAAKTRYKRTESACRAEFVSDGILRVDFSEPERALTAGQAVVLYDGDTVVCGGTIM
ncbi:MAG: tRNA 2-thiouridine(34) synthase MnmA, partial [Oscillospiraceae bacterium]|nr:tRNA 2-thiouridine(34) synthase MnmA [Oscillospiraceae bacterium]